MLAQWVGGIGKRPVRIDALGRLAGRPSAAVMMGSCLSGFGMCSMPTPHPSEDRITREACWGCIPGEPRVDQDTLDFDATCVAKRRALYIVYIYIMAVGVVQVGMLIASS